MQMQRKGLLSMLFDHDFPSQTVTAVIDNWNSSGFSCSIITESVFEEIKKMKSEEESISKL